MIDSYSVYEKLWKLLLAIVVEARKDILLKKSCLKICKKKYKKWDLWFADVIREKLWKKAIQLSVNGALDTQYSYSSLNKEEEEKGNRFLRSLESFQNVIVNAA